MNTIIRPFSFISKIQRVTPIHICDHSINRNRKTQQLSINRLLDTKKHQS